jgi:hypothetical protein
MTPLYYFDKVNNTSAVAPISALIFAPDIRGYTDDKTVNILLTNGRIGTATVADLRKALGSTRYVTVCAQAGSTIHALDKDGNIHKRNVIAWSIPIHASGQGQYGRPVPDSDLPENIIGSYGGDYVCVERPDGTCMTESREWKSFDDWVKEATAKLKRKGNK